MGGKVDDTLSTSIVSERHWGYLTEAMWQDMYQYDNVPEESTVCVHKQLLFAWLCEGTKLLYEELHDLIFRRMLLLWDALVDRAGDICDRQCRDVVCSSLRVVYRVGFVGIISS